MNYGKITKQELSPELVDAIENASGESVVFMTEGNEIPVEERKDGVLYILELPSEEDNRERIVKESYAEIEKKMEDLRRMME